MGQFVVVVAVNGCCSARQLRSCLLPAAYSARRQRLTDPHSRSCRARRGGAHAECVPCDRETFASTSTGTAVDVAAPEDPMLV
ncbi:hypothetical protein BC827DRAFT_1233509 [Russula dissimulans]|nr:hypothetical protein BC827DRAFT_1233509 [Russula dissimulans]